MMFFTPSFASVAVVFCSSLAVATPRALPFLQDVPRAPEMNSSRVVETSPLDSVTMSTGQPAVRSGVTYVDPERVGDLVTTMRESVCSKVGKGSIRMWLKLNATAQIVGIGGSSEGGVEVNILCGP